MWGGGGGKGEGVLRHYSTRFPPYVSQVHPYWIVVGSLT